MSAVLFTNGKFQALNAAGICPGAELETYRAGTLIPQATFTDQSGSSFSSNPVICDAAGQANVWLDAAATYRMRLYTATVLGRVLTWDVDNIVADPTAQLVADLATSADPTKAAGQVGFNELLSYTPGTVGAKLRAIVFIAKDAVGDWNGSTGTDNTAFLNAAINAVAAAGGGIVYIPPGNYYCTGLVGSDPNSLTSFHENVEIHGAGKGATTLTFVDTYSGTCLCLNGNEVAIRDLTVRSKRTLNHHNDLTAQRVVYQLGIWVGSKNNIGTTATFRNGAQVTGCQVLDMNVPIVTNMAGRVLIAENVVDRFTDTGILQDNVTTDIWVTRNKITNGGDDHIFVRHYATSPWAVAGNYCGRVFILDNVCADTFGKNIGIGGFGDVLISGNYCQLSWAGGINLEKDDWYKTNAANYRNLRIIDNDIVDAGRNFNTAEPVAAHQVASAGENPSGIHTVYRNTTGAINYQNVSIHGNKIANPYKDGIALAAVDGVSVNGNTFTAGSKDHGAGSVNTQGVCVYGDTLTKTDIYANTVVESLGIQFANCYSFAAGGGISAIFVHNNLDKSSAAAIVFSDGTAKAATQYIRRRDDDLSADRGDANVTLTAGLDKRLQRFNTALSVNRTVTLSTTGAVKGDAFRVVRQGGGAFTLDVGGLKTIPNSTAAFVDVEYEGSGWVLTGYGAL